MITGRTGYGGLGQAPDSGFNVDSAIPPGPLTNISTGIQTGFSTATSGWGGMEWAILLAGGYALLSTILTTRRGVSRARGAYTRVRSRSRRRRELQEDLRHL